MSHIINTVFENFCPIYQSFQKSLPTLPAKQNRQASNRYLVISWQTLRVFRVGYRIPIDRCCCTLEESLESTNHPFRKENDLNQTSMILFVYVNLQRCKKPLHKNRQIQKWLVLCLHLFIWKFGRYILNHTTTGNIQQQ